MSWQPPDELHIRRPVPRAAIPRLELYRFLLGKSRLLEPPAHFPGRLREVYEQEVADFGAAQVLASAGRAAGPSEAPGMRAFSLVVLVFLISTVVAAAGS